MEISSLKNSVHLFTLFMHLITTPIPLSFIIENANCMNPEGKQLCKAVVDIAREIMVIGGGMHVDEEGLLLDEESEQSDLWGINLYPDQFGTENFVEFDSMINVRPLDANRSRYVESLETRSRIISIVTKLVHA